MSSLFEQRETQRLAELRTAVRLAELLLQEFAEHSINCPVCEAECLVCGPGAASIAVGEPAPQWHRYRHENGCRVLLLERAIAQLRKQGDL